MEILHFRKICHNIQKSVANEVRAILRGLILNTDINSNLRIRFLVSFGPHYLLELDQTHFPDFSRVLVHSHVDLILEMQL